MLTVPLKTQVLTARNFLAFEAVEPLGTWSWVTSSQSPDGGNHRIERLDDRAYGRSEQQKLPEQEVE
jgi:hypothetical protein